MNDDSQSSSAPRASTRAALYAATMLLVIAYLYLRHRSLAALLLALGHGQTPLHDYQAFFYPMGRSLLTWPHPISGFVYTPFAALLFVALGQLPYTVSAALWTAILLGAVLMLARHSARLATPAAVLGLALTFGSMPVLHDLKFGQVSLLIVVALLGCAALYERGRVWPAAACLAFAASLKLYPLLFLCYFIFKRDHRAVLASGTFMLLMLLALPAAILGFDHTLEFYREVATQLDGRFGAGIADINSQSLRSLLDRWFLAPLSAISTFAKPVLDGIRYASCAALLFVTYRLARSTNLEATRWAFLWLFLCTPFFVATSWPHYFVYLPPVIASIMADGLKLSPLVRARNVVLASAGCSALVCSMVFFDLVDDRKLYARSGALFFANLFALIALLTIQHASSAHARGGRRP